MEYPIGFRIVDMIYDTVPARELMQAAKVRKPPQFVAHAEV
jgi:hypothetical protein